MSPPLDVTCGGDPCVGEGDASLALLAGEGPLGTMRLFYWLVVGFPSPATFEATFDDEERAALPFDASGMTGSIESMRGQIVDAAKEAFPAVESCTAASLTTETPPITLADGAVISFDAATLSAPASFPKHTTYDHRVKYVKVAEDESVLLGTFEFYCDYAGMTALLTRKDADGNVKSSYQMFYDREDADKLFFDFYLYDEGTFTGSSLTLGLITRVDAATKDLQSWVSRTGPKDDTHVLGYRYAIHANYETQQTSFFVLGIGDGDSGAGSYTQEDWDALDNAISDTVDDGIAASSDAGSDNTRYTGCSPDFDTPREELTSADVCEGMDLVPAPAPAYDAEATLSLKWVQGNLKTAVLGVE